jgi:hypothetical protein
MSESRRLPMDQASADRVEAFLNAGSELAGPVAGTAIGLFLGGPAGALAGAALGPLASWTFQRTAVDFATRVLSHRERERAAGVFLMAAGRLQEKTDQGYELRSDDFFVARSPGTARLPKRSSRVCSSLRSGITRNESLRTKPTCLPTSLFSPKSIGQTRSSLFGMRPESHIVSCNYSPSWREKTRSGFA